MSATSPSSIAVVKPCCIGDCVMALPAIDALCQAAPQADIDIFVGVHSRPVFATDTRLNRLVRIPDTITPSSAMRLALKLKPRRYSWIVLLERSRLLRAAVRLAGAQAISTVLTMVPEERHETEAYLDVVRALGVDASLKTARLALDEATRDLAASIAPDVSCQTVVIQPGGGSNPSAHMEEKRWPLSRYAELVTHLVSRGHNVALSGGPTDVDACRALATELQLPANRVFAGRADLLTTAALIERAGLYVGGDTGMSHISAAVGTPSVVIFGPTNPRRYRPLGDHVRIVAPPGAWNIPDRDLRRTPRDRPMAGVEDVAVQAVFAACDELIQRKLSACRR